jgi:hypothetical protein
MTSTDVERVLWLDPISGGTQLVPREYALDDCDRDILRRRWSRLENVAGPRVGDYVRFADGTERRFAHDWDEYGLQTTDERFGPMSFYIGDEGCSYSGSLNPCVKREALTLAKDQWGSVETKEGHVWFFHHDSAGAGRGVPAFLPFRVYKTDEQPTA